jgi:hypothetical protein
MASRKAMPKTKEWIKKSFRLFFKAKTIQLVRGSHTLSALLQSFMLMSNTTIQKNKDRTNPSLQQSSETVVILH